MSHSECDNPVTRIAKNLEILATQNGLDKNGIDVRICPNPENSQATPLGAATDIADSMDRLVKGELEKL